ncbi:uncharacterized protein [Spinacia oleracea]|uniref:Uncharacterized protein isoform X1 n=1 Tax=Spinacia oleracea TaxID=3562 RepID=A0ABM3RVD7_SPIOL|nr:uncharacterized protein LOC110804834 isoform X1 [Spinacia oleracea]
MLTSSKYPPPPTRILSRAHPFYRHFSFRLSLDLFLSPPKSLPLFLSSKPLCLSLLQNSTTFLPPSPSPRRKILSGKGRSRGGVVPHRKLAVVVIGVVEVEKMVQGGVIRCSSYGHWVEQISRKMFEEREIELLGYFLSEVVLLRLFVLSPATLEFS